MADETPPVPVSTFADPSVAPVFTGFPNAVIIGVTLRIPSGRILVIEGPPVEAHELLGEILDEHGDELSGGLAVRIEELLAGRR